MTVVTRPCVDGGRHEWSDRRCTSCFRRESFTGLDQLRRCGGASNKTHTWRNWGCRRCGDDGTVVSCWHAGIKACPGGLSPDDALQPSRLFSWCDFCQVRALRLLSKEERRPVEERLDAEWKEVEELYGHEIPKFSRREPPYLWKERYPAWHERRTARMEQQEQRRQLRKGAATLSSIRKHLRDRRPLPPTESRPARTSRT